MEWLDTQEGDVIYMFSIDSAAFDGITVLDDGGFANGFNVWFDTLHASPHTTVPVPEPKTFALIRIGIAGLAYRRKKRK